VWSRRIRTLSADLVTRLQRLDSDYSSDLVIMEASGAANPRSILSALPYYRGTTLESVRTVSVPDPLRLEMLVEVMIPPISSRIQHAGLVVIRKCDPAKAEEVECAHRSLPVRRARGSTRRPRLAPSGILG